MRKDGFTLSPSKIATYQECPRKYRFLYIDRLGPKFRKARPATTLGINVHATLKEFFALPPRRRRPEQLETLLESRWAANRAGFKDSAQEEHYKTRAFVQLHQFARAFDLEAKPLLLEKRVRREVNGLTLEGIVDRVDREGDSAHLMDYKTGTSQKDMEPFSLYFYALALHRRKGMPPVERLSYVFLQDGITRSWRYDPAQAMQALESTLETAYAISGDTEHRPRPGWACGNCDFLPICREGQRVVAARRVRG